MIRLIVGLHKERLITTDGYHMVVHQVFVQEKEGGRLVVLQDYNASNVADVRIMLSRQIVQWLPWIHWTQDLKIPKPLKKGIVEYFRKYHAQQNLASDCYSFVCLVHGIDIRGFDKEAWLKKGTPRSHLWQRKTGDTVFLLNLEKQSFLHAAIYVGKGLYVSIYGAGGDLEIATLKDMREGYSAEDILHIGVSE